jgi:hypothetical protein
MTEKKKKNRKKLTGYTNEFLIQLVAVINASSLGKRAWLV